MLAAHICYLPALWPRLPKSKRPELKALGGLLKVLENKELEPTLRQRQAPPAAPMGGVAYISGREVVCPG